MLCEDMCQTAAAVQALANRADCGDALRTVKLSITPPDVVEMAVMGP